MGRIAAEYANRIWLTNDNPRTESPEKIISEIEEGIPSFAESRVSIVKNRGDAIREAISEGGAETIVLIAGKGHETYQEIGEKSQPFDDAEVAKSLLEECYE